MTDLSQSMEALKLANQIRIGQSQIRRQVGEGFVGVMHAIDSDLCRNLLVVNVLQWQKHWGRRLSSRLMQDLAISEHTTCGNLTVRQRRLIARYLRTSRRGRTEMAFTEQTWWHTPEEAA